jgi:hypothetical protein
MVRFIITIVMLALPLSAQPKSTAELVLECGEYAQLTRTGLPVGVDQYLIASCFAYMEGFLDQVSLNDQEAPFCLPEELGLGDLALIVTGIENADRRPASAARDLSATLLARFPCPKANP